MGLYKFLSWVGAPSTFGALGCSPFSPIVNPGLGTMVALKCYYECYIQRSSSGHGKIHFYAQYFNKKLNCCWHGHIYEMSKRDWPLKFVKVICNERFGIAGYGFLFGPHTNCGSICHQLATVHVAIDGRCQWWMHFLWWKAERIMSLHSFTHILC